MSVPVLAASSWHLRKVTTPDADRHANRFKTPRIRFEWISTIAIFRTMSPTANLLGEFSSTAATTALSMYSESEYAILDTINLD